MIYHEQLISSLCKDHLFEMWSEGMRALPTVANRENGVLMPSPILAEFAGCPLELAFRLFLVAQEAKKRDYVQFNAPTPFDASDTPFSQMMKERNRYTPWYSLEQQREYMKSKNCECQV